MKALTNCNKALRCNFNVCLQSNQVKRTPVDYINELVI